MQKISYKYNSPLSSRNFNERFAAIFGGSILSGFRFSVGGSGFTINLIKDIYETNLLVTETGITIEESDDVMNAVDFVTNTTTVDRWDSVYLIYDHETPENNATYVTITGDSETGDPAPLLDSDIHTFLGLVKIPAENQPIEESGLAPLNVGFKKFNAANDAHFMSGIDVQEAAEFFDKVIVHGDANFLNKIVSEVESEFKGNITIPLEPNKDVHAASKFYVDSMATGLAPKRPVKATTLGPVSLNAEQTIDGVEVLSGDRVLVKDQANTAENGIYVVSTGAWSRADDVDENEEVYSGIHCFVQEGTQYKDSAWVLITDDSVVLGTTPLEFVQYGGASNSIVGDGLKKDGNKIEAVPATADALGSVIKGNGLNVTSSGVMSTNLGEGLEFQGTDPNKRVAANFLPSSTENGNATTIARGDHIHDSRYYPKVEGDNRYWMKSENEDMIIEQVQYNTYAQLYENLQKFYRRVDHKRPDGTIFMRSTLSNLDTDGYPQSLRLDFYDDNGSTIIDTQLWNLSYDANGQVVNKVKS